MRIDAHHHLWSYSANEYDWITETMSGIRRDFLPTDLRAAAASAEITGVVTVQARQSTEETAWLLSLADEEPLMLGVIGWLPLRSAAIGALLEAHAARPKLKGLRHVLQGEADPDYMLHPDFQRGISALRAHDLAYDLLIVQEQLPHAIRLVDAHPDQRFILDHIAKPHIAAGVLEPWRGLMRELARRPNVWCKLSGVVTEADWGNWTEDSLHPWLEAALETFGPRRLMFGSDWPVCLVACDYPRWVDIAGNLVSCLSADERARFWHLNAREAYHL